MPTPADTRMEEADARRGVRLTVPLLVGSVNDLIALEPAHCERMFRTVAYTARRDGRLSAGEPLAARIVPGDVRERHGEVYCLESCAVELLGAAGRLVARAEFPRRAFAAFAIARATHLLADGSATATESQVTYSLHAADSPDSPFPVVMPDLPALSVETLAAAATACGRPEDDWVATFVSRDVAAGLDELADVSRSTGLEAAGRIHTRVGLDTHRRCFVRILDRLVIARDTRATSLTVVSTAASWADFLAAADAHGPQAPASVHTHLHLSDDSTRGAAPRLTSAETLRPSDRPCISVYDVVTHYTAFPDPLSAAVIVSLFPDRRVVSLYGYGPGAELREEPGYWLLNTRT